MKITKKKQSVTLKNLILFTIIEFIFMLFSPLYVACKLVTTYKYPTVNYCLRRTDKDDKKKPLLFDPPVIYMIFFLLLSVDTL